jgi:hypothetical protein
LIFLDSFQCIFFPRYPTVIATIKSNSQEELVNAISKLNQSGGGIIYIDTPIINIGIGIASPILKLSGSNSGGIIGKRQSDGSYPVIDFIFINWKDTGFELSGSNQFIKYLVIQYARIGVRITGSNNYLDHIITRYSFGPGIQLSDNAISNTLNYCYSYRNIDISGFVKASGFSLKPGSSQTYFNYCFAFDNFYNGWDVNDKEGDSSVSVSYLHSACWNNGNPEVFIGIYDYNNNWPLDKNLMSIKHMMAGDLYFERNYNDRQFSINPAHRIYGYLIPEWLNIAETAISSSGFTFGSKTTQKSADVKKTADFSIAFDHRSIGFDNNDSGQCTGYISNCAAFKNKINYQLP